LSTFYSIFKSPVLDLDERTHFIYITNILSAVFASLSLILAFILYFLFGWGITLWLIVGVCFLFGAVIGLNRLGFSHAGRLLFCLLPVVMTMVITLLGKLLEPRQSYITYFDSRFILLITTVLPAIVFDIREYIKIGVVLTFTFISLIFFDPIHNLFGLGYYQRGFTVESYYYINYIVFISFVALLTAIFILKWRNYRVSLELKRVLAEIQQVNNLLLIRNTKLEALTQEMEAQNEEMQQQNEELQTNHEMLEQANRLISEQRTTLHRYNLELEQMVKEKSADLVATNEELVKANN
jgi:hypothetical protein